MNVWFFNRYEMAYTYDLYFQKNISKKTSSHFQPIRTSYASMKTLILDNIEKTCGTLLSKNGFSVTEKAKLTKDELNAMIGEYDVVLVRSATKITADLIAAAPNLKLIGRAGAGVDNIDCEAATRQGVIVMNTPGGNTISAAEHTCAMLMSVARLVPQAHAEVRQGIWDKKKWLGRELDGKTLAVIGLGKIGREVAQRMQGFGMKIIAFDPMLPVEVAAKMGITLLSVEENFRQADFITIHTPYNEATKNLVSAKTLALMKDSVRIVNCARGGIINESDLADAITSGKVAAAALDVFEVEPVDKENPLLKLENVIVTPHIAASTVEAQEKVAIQIAEQIVEWKTLGKLEGAVNASAAAVAQNDEAKAYLNLAEKIGLILAQLVPGKPKRLIITNSGDFLRRFAEAIIAATLKGLIDGVTGKQANYINAFSMATDMGVDVEQRREKENADYTSLIRVEYETDKGKRSIGGAVLGAKDLRIVMVDKFMSEFKPEGNILIYMNDDKPGVVVGVSTVLLGDSINIANLTLVRNEEKTKALTVVGIDGEMSGSTVEKIAKIQGIYEPRLVRL
jgi:D-3-phosphoglycerate dehydrogenase / 2-oxoglutarate reductase